MINFSVMVNRNSKTMRKIIPFKYSVSGLRMIKQGDISFLNTFLKDNKYSMFICPHSGGKKNMVSTRVKEINHN